MDRERIYRQWLQQRRSKGTGADLRDRIMVRLPDYVPDFEVPPPPPAPAPALATAPAPDGWPEGLSRIAAAIGLVGLGLFRLLYVSASVMMP